MSNPSISTAERASDQLDAGNYDGVWDFAAGRMPGSSEFGDDLAVLGITFLGDDQRTATINNQLPDTVEANGASLPVQAVDFGTVKSQQFQDGVAYDEDDSDDGRTISRRGLLAAAGTGIAGLAFGGLGGAAVSEFGSSDDGEWTDRMSDWDTPVAGVSIGHPDITAGTLGSPPVVRLGDNVNQQYVLTNQHVAAPDGPANVGDPVLQPGPYDGGDPSEAFGTVAEASDLTLVSIEEFRDIANNIRDPANIPDDKVSTTDSALVGIDDGAVESQRVLEFGDIGDFATKPSMWTDYTKSGRTTGSNRTQPLIARDITVPVRYSLTHVAIFRGMDAFGPISRGGDSGSLIGYREDDGTFRPTHLLFAGSSRVTIGIPLDNVFERHGRLSVVGAD